MFVYSGNYVLEGHNVPFEIKDNDTVLITEIKAEYKNHRIMSLDDAIEYQNILINSGYDKIS